MSLRTIIMMQVCEDASRTPLVWWVGGLGGVKWCVEMKINCMHIFSQITLNNNPHTHITHTHARLPHHVSCSIKTQIRSAPHHPEDPPNKNIHRRYAKSFYTFFGSHSLTTPLPHTLTTNDQRTAVSLAFPNAKTFIFQIRNPRSASGFSAPITQIPPPPHTEKEVCVGRRARILLNLV